MGATYTATDEWDEVAEWWAFHDSDGLLRFYEALTEGFDVQAAGANSTTISLYFDQDEDVA